MRSIYKDNNETEEKADQCTSNCKKKPLIIYQVSRRHTWVSRVTVPSDTIETLQDTLQWYLQHLSIMNTLHYNTLLPTLQTHPTRVCHALKSIHFTHTRQCL